MPLNFGLVDKVPPVMLLPPASDAAGRQSSFRSVRWGEKSYVICHINQGNAAPVTLSIFQGQDVSGTNAKSTNAVPIWLNDNTATGDGFVAQTPANSFTTDATIADKIVIFEILPIAAMDINNRFISLSVRTSASNASNYTEAKLIVFNTFEGSSIPSTYNN